MPLTTVPSSFHLLFFFSEIFGIKEIIQTIFSLINSLLDKGLIQMEGSVRSGKTYARTFASTMSRPEYYAKMVAHTLNDKEIVVFKRMLRLETKKVDGVEDNSEAIMQ